MYKDIQVINQKPNTDLLGHPEYRDKVLALKSGYSWLQAGDTQRSSRGLVQGSSYDMDEV